MFFQFSADLLWFSGFLIFHDFLVPFRLATISKNKLIVGNIWHTQYLGSAVLVWPVLESLSPSCGAPWRPAAAAGGGGAGGGGGTATLSSTAPSENKEFLSSKLWNLKFLIAGLRNILEHPHGIPASQEKWGGGAKKTGSWEQSG